jgi:hypothetical protein
MIPSGEQTVPVLGVTNEDVFPSKSTDLGDDPSGVSASRELSIESALSLQKQEPCGERSQSLCFIRSP